MISMDPFGIKLSPGGFFLCRIANINNIEGFDMIWEM